MVRLMITMEPNELSVPDDWVVSRLPAHSRGIARRFFEWIYRYEPTRDKSDIAKLNIFARKVTAVLKRLVRNGTVVADDPVLEDGYWIRTYRRRSS